MPRSLTSDYRQRKAYFDELLTLFGRKPVAEALATEHIIPVCLHLADSNRPSRALADMIETTQARGGEVRYHARDALSRISKNRRQDQGVALDVRAPTFQKLDAAITGSIGQSGLIAVDGITNPGNLGMIIRAVGASPRDGLILARSGNARIDGLVIKASAGAIFRTPIFHCDTLPEALASLHRAGYLIYGLAGNGSQSITDIEDRPHVLVLGNETHGLSDETRQICDGFVGIPMSRNVESLNVAVAAGVIAFAPLFTAAPR